MLKQKNIGPLVYRKSRNLASFEVIGEGKCNAKGEATKIRNRKC